MTSLFAKPSPVAVDTISSRLRRLLWRMSMVGMRCGPHITRYSMYERLARVGSRLPVQAGRVLAVSHSANLAQLMGIQPTETVEANYPEHTMISLAFPDESFDFVVSDQVLEHVEGNPEQAARECHRLLRPGGVAIHTTCLINPIHGVPRDFWRFTPDGLRWLHRDWGSIIECDGWGSFEAWRVIRDGLRFDGVPHATWHPFHRLAVRNDPEWPVTVWIVAQK